MLGSIRRLPLLLVVCVIVGANNRFPGPKFTHTNNHYVAQASQQVPQQQAQQGYRYPAPVPVQGSANAPRPQTVPFPAAQSQQNIDSAVVVPEQQGQTAPAAVQQQSRPTVSSAPSPTGAGDAASQQLAASAATDDRSRQLHAHHMPQLQKIDVACGKERMTVRVTFDQPFNGIIYAKNHYKDPNCRFVNANAGQRMFQFDMAVGSCGVSFIDSGLTQGGQAYLEGLLVIILEQGVQEAWDAARRLRCLWEGNIDQTVTFPLAVNMLDSQTLTFSGDTASASLEIQTGRGPRAPAVQGLVRIGDLLTAVVTVIGDADFDLVVRNCVATDGSPANRVVLSDNRGCATKPKLMGGWLKQKNPGNVLAYAYLSAFKFPDLMDLFLECTVSLCKGACEECPKEEYHELHVPNHAADGADGAGNIDVRVAARARRSAVSNSTQGGPEESLRLRRVVHVVSPDDFPEFISSESGNSPAVFGGSHSDCFSLITLMAAVFVALLLVLTAAVVISLFRRSNLRSSENPMKLYSSAHRP